MIWAGKQIVERFVNDISYTYMDINFPHSNEEKIFIKDLISEKDVMLFCMVLMK